MTAPCSTGIDFLADVPRLSSRQSDGDVPDAEAKEHELDRHVTLCVNDARRKQLYFSLNHGSISLPDEDAAERRWIEMDIDYPEHIVERVERRRSRNTANATASAMWWM